MIDPDTPPGTVVVAVDDVLPQHGLPGVQRGGYYTVARIVPTSEETRAATGRSASVVIEGHGVGVSYENDPRGWRAFFRRHPTYWAYPLTVFRYLDLGGLDLLLDSSERLS